jgi:hypothetical protein
MGYRGPVLHARPVAEPHNLGNGWVGFNYAKAFRCPVKIVNDAAMQAPGSLQGREDALPRPRHGFGHDHDRGRFGDEAVSAPVLTTALYERFSSRGEADFQNRVLSAMRYEFGGHLEKPAGT